MQPRSFQSLLLAGASLAAFANAIEPYQIQGSTPISPYAGQTLTGIHGIVTAKGPSGWWIQGASDNNDATSDSIYIFTSSAAIRNQTVVGDEIVFNGKVAEYRADTGDLYLTEITSPSNITKLTTGNVVKPLVIGIDRFPPTTSYSAIDDANGGVFGYPNNVTTYSAANATAQPDKYGLDFWASLDGQLVTVPSPVALGFDTQYSDFWVHGAWPVTGKNARGGLTMTADAGGVVDANPEAIIIGSPLDGTKNPGVVTMGSTISDITGVVTFAFDFYRILPLTAPQVIAYPTAVADPTKLTSTPLDPATKCQQITFGSYNVENLSPTSAHMKNVSEHLVNWLKSPDLLILQEVQDQSGPADDGEVSSEGTLAALRDAIVAAGGANYSWAVVDPVNNMDGGQPGGNIRVAFMYRPEVLELVKPNTGSATNGTSVTSVNKEIELTLNPGRIDPSNAVFDASRKPLAALFQSLATKERILAIDVHQSSKGGSSPIHGDARPPVNGAIEARIGQANVTASFIASVLAADPNARVVVGGDFNDFTFTKAAFAPYFANGMVEDADIVVNIPPVERYTYSFDMNAQQLDHILVSKEVAKTLEYEHIHVNTWASSYEARVSDHDPSVGRVKLCTTSSTDPQCSYKIENWCAAPLPKFNSFSTCLSAAGACFEQNIDCYKTLKFPSNLKCSKHGLKCVEYTTFCTQCLKGGSCTSFPP